MMQCHTRGPHSECDGVVVQPVFPVDVVVYYGVRNAARSPHICRHVGERGYEEVGWDAAEEESHLWRWNNLGVR